MSVISISGLMLGYLTLPLASAAGWPGSCLTRKADGSVRTGPSATMRASSARSISERKVAILRRKGSAPGPGAVESALAMFSEITRMRPAWARSPEAAMAIERKKSMAPLPPLPAPLRALAERGLDQAESAAVEGGRRLEVHLVGGDLEHLVLEAHRVARRAHLEIALPRALKPRGIRARAGKVERARPHHGQSGRGPRLVEIRHREITRLEIRGIGVGDVLCQQLLAFLMPLHLGPQHREDRNLRNRHRCPRSGRRTTRSEEHTSELQSQSNLVCRLLLEKKKKNKNNKILQKKKNKNKNKKNKINKK